MTLFRRFIGATLPLVPKFVVRRVASRYVAGEDLPAAIDCAERLEARGFKTTLALLGEEVTDRAKCEQAVAEHRKLFEEIAERGLEAGVSLKLTLLGLDIDEDYCRDNLLGLLQVARSHDIFVRIDMEDHTCTDATLRIYEQGLAAHPRLGVVLQAYLRRTMADIDRLPRGADVRLCKGIYIEPAHVAYQDYDTVRLNFVQCLERLFERGAKVGIATHDEYLIAAGAALVQKLGLGGDRYEFQTLLGVTPGQRDALRNEGHRVRVYLPYGHDWYLYSVRRLRENPKIAVYVLRAMLGMKGPKG